MFQPQPTPFSAFFPAYLQVPVEDLQRQDDVLREQVNDTSFVATQAGSFSSYHHQAPFPALVGSGAAPTGVVNPCPGPGPGSVAGPGGLGHSGAGPRPGPTGVSQGANAPLSPIHFPLHGAIPHSQLEQPAAAPSLFDHASSSTNLRRASRPPFSSTSRRATPSTKMESNQSLEDDLAAQEAAARTWQPELEVCYPPSCRPALPSTLLIQPLAHLGSELLISQLTTYLMCRTGAPRRREDPHRRYHCRVCKGRSYLRCEDDGKPLLNLRRPTVPASKFQRWAPTCICANHVLGSAPNILPLQTCQGRRQLWMER